MKITNVVFIVSLVACATCGAMTSNDFVSVTNDWYHGEYSNVCALAQYREAQNTNDLVAAYIMYEWNMILGTKESFSNSIEKVLIVSDRMTNVIFVAEYASARDGFVNMRDQVIPMASEARVEADWQKARFKGKRFTEWRILKILWDEHLW